MKQENKQRIEYRIKTRATADLPDQVRGLNTKINAYSPFQALSGYLAEKNLRFLYEDLRYRFIFGEGIYVYPADGNARKIREEETSSISRDSQLHYLSNLFGHATFDKEGLRPVDAYIAEQEEKFSKMPHKQLFAVFMKYYEN